MAERLFGAAGAAARGCAARHGPRTLRGRRRAAQSAPRRRSSQSPRAGADHGGARRRARRRPSVARVLVPADVAALGRLPLLVPHSSLVAPASAEILPQEVVSYAGQPVVLVVA